MKTAAIRVGGLLAVSFLAACAGGQPQTTAKATDQTVQPSGIATVLSPEPNAKEAPVKDQQADGAAVSPMPSAKAPPLEPRFVPRELVGLSRGGVETALGEPTLQRRDPPAEIWQYAKENCVLLVFLYETAPEKFSVRHVELRRRAGPEPASLDRETRRSCLLGFDGAGLRRQSKAGES